MAKCSQGMRNGQVFNAAFRSGGLSPDAEAVTRKIWANQPSRLQC